MKTVMFYGEECTVQRGGYGNGNTALQLWTDEGPMATATVNLEDVLPKDKAYIKDYGENTGMLDALMEAGIVEAVIGQKQSGFVLIPLCVLNLEGIV